MIQRFRKRVGRIISIELLLSSNLEKQQNVFHVEMHKANKKKKILGNEKHCNVQELKMRFVEF